MIKEIKQKKARLTLHIKPDSKKQAQLLAIECGSTISELFENLLNGGIKNAK